MDPRRFDALVRGLTTSGSRRAAVRLLVGTLGTLSLARRPDAVAKPIKAKPNSPPARGATRKPSRPQPPSYPAPTRHHHHHHHHHPPTGGGCTVQPANGQLALSFSVALPHDHLTLAHQTTQDRTGTLAEQTTVQLAGQPLLQVATTVASATDVTVNLQYGAAFTGIGHAVFRTNDGQTITGEVDGRAIIPMAIQADPAALAFADGAPPPTITLDGVSHAALTALFQQAQQTAQGCQLPSAGGGGSGNAAHRRARRAPAPSAQLRPQADPGHSSDPQDTPLCYACEAGCDSAFAACSYGVVSGCAAWFIGAGICIVIGLAACFVAADGCHELCNGTGAPCCPVGCGKGFGPSNGCCERGETCLDPTSPAGRCCSTGLQPCRATSCCDVHDVCLVDGSCCPPSRQSCASQTQCCAPGEVCQQGQTCCPPQQQVCGGRCCQPGESCLNGNGPCCPTAKFCGPVCCDALDDCIDVSRGTCCGGLNHPCGTACCAPDEQCIGGACCSPARACGGVCCPAGAVCQDPLTHRCGTCPSATVACTDLGANGCCQPGQDCCFTPGQGLSCCPSGTLCCEPVDGRPRGCYSPAVRGCGIQ